MPGKIETEGIGTVKKELHIFYVLDTSGSMSGEAIGALNDAMRATVEELKKKDGENADLRIGVLEYNSKARWVTKGTNGLENLQDFIWTDLQATGMTALGAAMKELNTSLSRNDKMKSATGNKIPVVIFMSDGYPNDNWEDALKTLAENKWYRAAIKIAFALGEDADEDSLAKVVGVRKDGSIVPNREAVIHTNDLQVFSDMIQIVSVGSTLAASTSRTVDDPVDPATIIQSGISAGGYTVGTDGTVMVDPNPPIDVYAGTDGDDNFGNLT